MKYIAKRKYTKPKTLLQRIEEKIFYSPDGCWYWTGSTINGYGVIGYNYTDEIVTRVYYRIMRGDFDKKLLVCHHCDNPLCLNPDHLFIGTYQDNTNDMIKKGRKRIVNGSIGSYAKLTEEDVMEIVSLRKNAKYDDIAKRFNVSKSAIKSIFYGRSWKHLKLKRERKFETI